MALRDEFKKERAALREKPFKDKFQFFWKYYKWHALIWTIGLLFLGGYIYKRATTPYVLLNGIMLNASNTEEAAATELADRFAEAYEIDKTSGLIVFNTALSYTPGEKGDNSSEGVWTILSEMQSKSLDFIAGPISSMQDLAYNSIFVDLRSFLTPEQIAFYEPYFLYIDVEVIEKLDEAYDKKEDTSSISIPDCTKPDEMTESVPVMIDISKCQQLSGIYGSPGEILAFGVLADHPDSDLTLKFIQYLMN